MAMKHCKYTRDELRKYCQDENGYVKCVQQTMHIGLPPWGLTKIRETVRDIVAEEKFGNFDVKLNGIVLDVQNIKILGTEYVSQNDSSALHVNLNAIFYVFRPQVGAIMKGTIKHVALHHISVTIYRFFNVSVPIKKKDNLKIDMEVDVKLTKFDFEDPIPYFEGKLELPLVLHKENSTDSGISSISAKVKLEKMKNSKAESSSSDSDTDSDSDNEPSAKVKSEKMTNGKVESSSSDTDSESDSDSDKKPTAKIKIKREPVSSSKSSSSSESDSEDAFRNTSNKSRKTPLTKSVIKKERKSSTSSSSSDESIVKEKKSSPATAIKLGKRKIQSSLDEPPAKIKKELHSSHGSDTRNRSQIKNVKMETSSSSSESSDESDVPNLWQIKKNIKKETPSSSSTSSDESDTPNRSQIGKNIKKEASASSSTSSDESDTSNRSQIGKNIKKEASTSSSTSSDESDTPNRSQIRNMQLLKKVKKEESVLSSSEVTSPKKEISANKKDKKGKVSESSSSDSSSAGSLVNKTDFSPGLSSTKLPGNTRKLKKNSEVKVLMLKHFKKH